MPLFYVELYPSMVPCLASVPNGRQPVETGRNRPNLTPSLERGGRLEDWFCAYVVVNKACSIYSRALWCRHESPSYFLRIG